MAKYFSQKPRERVRSEVIDIIETESVYVVIVPEEGDGHFGHVEDGCEAFDKYEARVKLAAALTQPEARLFKMEED